MNLHEYEALIRSLLKIYATNKPTRLEVVDTGTHDGSLQGTVQLDMGYVLHFAEYVRLDPVLDVVKYRYHAQHLDGRPYLRWDNSPHHRHISTFPHHVHLPNGEIAESYVRNLHQALIFIETHFFTYSSGGGSIWPDVESDKE